MTRVATLLALLAVGSEALWRSSVPGLATFRAPHAQRHTQLPAENPDSDLDFDLDDAEMPRSSGNLREPKLPGADADARVENLVKYAQEMYSTSGAEQKALDQVTELGNILGSKKKVNVTASLEQMEAEQEQYVKMVKKIEQDGRIEAMSELDKRLDSLISDAELTSTRPPIFDMVEESDTQDDLAKAVAIAEKRLKLAKAERAARTDQRGAAIKRKTALIVASGKATATSPCKQLQEALQEAGWTVDVSRTASMEGQAVADALLATEKEVLAMCPTLILCPELDPDKGKGGFFGASLTEGLAPIGADVVETLLKAMPNLDHAVLLSVLGVDRAGKFPYSLLNAMGGLDKRQKAEQAVRLGSQTRGFDHTIIRVGKIVPGAGSDAAPVDLSPTDSIDDDVALPVVVSAVARSLQEPNALNATFSLAGTGTTPPTADEWSDLYLKLDGPELSRVALPATISVDKALLWLEEWTKLWEQPNSGLVTPIMRRRLSAVRGQGGSVAILFAPGAAYQSKADEKAELAENDGVPKPAGRKRLTSSKAGTQGGVEVIVDIEPQARVRVKRCAYTEGVAVKETSEATILRRLETDLTGFIQRNS